MIFCPHNPQKLGKKGFTLPELVVSIAIILTIFGFAGVNLLRVLPEADLTEISNTFMADAKSSQHSAMLGEASSSVQIDYGIKVDETSYTLFKGQVFAPGDPTNYTVAFPGSITATTGLPEAAGGAIVFSALTGDIKYFDAGHPEYYSVAFTGPYNRQLTIRFNKLGNVYYVNKN